MKKQLNIEYVLSVVNSYKTEMQILKALEEEQRQLTAPTLEHYSAIKFQTQRVKELHKQLMILQCYHEDMENGFKKRTS